MNILLFANVGGNDEGFYHAGDEAMFYETYRLYRKYLPRAKLTILSSKVSHQHLTVQEYNGLPWPTDKIGIRKYYFKLLEYFIIWRLTGISRFTLEELSFVKIINQQERIHFVGGGNLTSLFGSWLYYSYFIITISRLLGKEIILSSQTIGPLWGIDLLFTAVIMNMPNKILLRERIVSKTELLQYGIFFPQLAGMMDAAYSMPSTSTHRLPKKTMRLRVGISVHDWGEYGQRINDFIVYFIKEIRKEHSIELVLIPHVVGEKMSKWDSVYENNIVSALPKTVKIIRPTYRELMKTSKEPATTFKHITSQVDFMLTSRYHGLIFALSKNVPCVSFIMERYYRRKITKGLELTYGQNEDLSKYTIDLDYKYNKITALKTIKNVINNLSAEKDKLRALNKIHQGLEEIFKQHFL